MDSARVILQQLPPSLRQRVQEGEVFTARIQRVQGNSATIEIEGKSYRIQLVEGNLPHKTTVASLRYHPEMALEKENIGVQLRWSSRAQAINLARPDQVSNARPSPLPLPTSFNGLLVRVEMLQPASVLETSAKIPLTATPPSSQPGRPSPVATPAISPVNTVSTPQISTQSPGQALQTLTQTAGQTRQISTSPQVVTPTVSTPQMVTTTAHAGRQASPQQPALSPQAAGGSLTSTPSSVTPTSNAAGIPPPQSSRQTLTFQTTSSTPAMTVPQGQTVQLMSQATSSIPVNAQTGVTVPEQKEPLLRVTPPAQSLHIGGERSVGRGSSVLPSGATPSVQNTPVPSAPASAAHTASPVRTSSPVPTGQNVPAMTRPVTSMLSSPSRSTFSAPATSVVTPPTVVAGTSAVTMTTIPVSATSVPISAPLPAQQQAQVQQPQNFSTPTAPITTTTPVSPNTVPQATPQTMSLHVPQQSLQISSLFASTNMPSKTTVAVENSTVMASPPAQSHQGTPDKIPQTGQQIISNAKAHTPQPTIPVTKLAQNYQQAASVVSKEGMAVSTLAQMTKTGQHLRLQIYDPRTTPQNAHLTATVIGTDKAGGTIVATSRGQMALGLARPLPLNTELLLTEPAAFHPIVAQSRFTALESLLGSSGVLQKTAQSVIPRPDTKIRASMLFFLHALRQPAGLQSLFQNISPAELRQSSFFAAAEEEMTKAQPAPLPADPSWLHYNLPLQVADEIIKLFVYWRQGGGESQEQKPTDKGLFAIEGHHREVGRFRLDGQFLRPRFSLQWASDRAFGSEMENTLTRVFYQHSELYTLEGSIQFLLLGDRHLWMDDHHAEGQLRI